MHFSYLFLIKYHLAAALVVFAEDVARQFSTTILRLDGPSKWILVYIGVPTGTSDPVISGVVNAASSYRAMVNRNVPLASPTYSAELE